MIIKTLKRLRDWRFLPRTLYVAHDNKAYAKPTIVFLHGIAATSDTWTETIQHFDNKHYRVVTIDLLGFGMSPKPTSYDYTAKDHINYLHRTLRRAQINSFYLVGHSMGALIATEYARNYPHKIKGLILVSPPIFNVRPFDVKAQSKIAVNAYQKAYTFFEEHPNFTIGNAERIKRLLPIKSGFEISKKTWLPFKRSLKNTVRNEKFTENLLAINISRTIIYGALDPLIITSHVQALKDMPHTKVVRYMQHGHYIDQKFAKNIADEIVATTK